MSTINPEWAPPLKEGQIEVKDTNQARKWRYFGIVVAIIVVAYGLAQTSSAEIVNWGLIAFFSIFALSMVLGKREGNSLFGLILKSFIPPVFLIVVVLGSIFGGWATPTEAAGIGAFGAIVLAVFNNALSMTVLKDVCHRTALTTSMIFLIFLGATTFSYFFRALYGEDLIITFIEWLDFVP